MLLNLNTAYLLALTPMTVSAWLELNARNLRKRSLTELLDDEKAMRNVNKLLKGREVYFTYRNGSEKILRIEGKSVNSLTKKFLTKNGKEVSVKDYMWETYKIKISNQTIPLLVAKGRKGSEIFLVPECCT
jgi:hypothetical protein